jgi:hypothetical protein
LSERISLMRETLRVRTVELRRVKKFRFYVRKDAAQ